MRLLLSLFFCVLLVATAAGADEGAYGTIDHTYSTSTYTEINSHTNSNYGMPAGSTLRYLRLNSIENYEFIHMLSWQIKGSTIAHATQGLLSEQTDFTLRCSGLDVGQGIIMVQFDERHFYLFFNQFDRGALTGDHVCDVIYTPPDEMTISASPAWMTQGSPPFALHLVGNHPDYGINKYTPQITNSRIRYGTFWWNTLSWSPLFHNVTEIKIDREYGGTAFPSRFIVSTAVEGVVMDNDDSTSINTSCLFRPIETSVLSPLGTWFNYTIHQGAVSEDMLSGYVYDAARGFLMSGVNVTFEGLDFTTSGDGRFMFPEVHDPGFLNATFPGYVNFSLYIDPLVHSRYDIIMTENYTVPSGMSGVCGFVRDYDTLSGIEGALMTLSNSSYSTHLYSNQFGFFKFGVIEPGSYDVSAFHENYVDAYLNVSAPVDQYEHLDIRMVNKTSMDDDAADEDEEDARDIVSVFKHLFDTLGIAWSMAMYILSLIVILICALSAGHVGKGNSTAILIGGFFGSCLCIAAGWLPAYLFIIIICGVAFFIAKKMG